MEYLFELFDEASLKFKRHINPDENSRIIFSGIYGAGKTSFLEYFFNIFPDSDSETVSEYEVIRLFPVNYSVASNEDIFKYIKYDILLELMRKGIDLEFLDLELSHKLALYIKSNWKEIAFHVFKTATAIGKNFIPQIDYLEIITNFFETEYKHLDKYVKKGLAEKYDDSKIVDNFMRDIEKAAGSLFEESLIIKIIEKKIEELKGSIDKRKKVVLIIDDLDRIDPEHIFRILNVFAAHFDLSHKREANKFGLDKIILVCDIENLQSVFHHKYGPGTNFGGYIDKFYSDDVFNFNIVQILCNKILSLSGRYQIENIPIQEQERFRRVENMFHWLIKGFIRHGSLNLRGLTKFVDRRIPISWQENILLNSRNVNLVVTQHTYLWNLMLLSRIFGNKQSFLNAILKLDFYHLSQEGLNIELIFNNFLFWASIEQHSTIGRLSSAFFRIEKDQ